MQVAGDANQIMARAPPTAELCVWLDSGPQSALGEKNPRVGACGPTVAIAMGLDGASGTSFCSTVL